ncbi:CRISPR-associated endonuclease Cas1 [Corynebacterium flavescens]|uniref:CRISPR-associated endonuclease Cas1 n=1 Tax=Corynebacterium flavescens TaxID=28028 RepID=UPI003FD5C338
MKDEDLLPISLVLHTAFCPRRTWLELNGESTDTLQMQSGDSAHKLVDMPENSRVKRKFAVPISSDQLGIVGRLDELEISDDGAVHVVEYKATPVRRRAEVTPANRLQLTLQKMCLESAGVRVDSQAIYFSDHRRRIEVDLNEDDQIRAKALIEETREISSSAKSPPPLVGDERCTACSHASVCLPDEHQLTVVPRRINASDPDGQVLHLTVQGSRASLRRGRVVVSKAGENIGDVPIERVQGVVVHGNIDISSALNRTLLWNSVPIVWCSATGRVYGYSRATESPNGLARVQQHVHSHRGNLSIATGMIQAKILNQATLLRRNATESPYLLTLKNAASSALTAPDLPSLFGIEGEAAAEYFKTFPQMFRPQRLSELGWEWQGRHGRGADDPLNVLLNYCYGLLKTEAIRAVLSCGLDPHAGFLHSSNRNKPALALDLMEEFRAPVADSTVVALVNRREIKDSDFSTVGDAYRLRDSGRKKVIGAFERRIQTSFRHPTFGYDVTWRRAIEVQARMILGVLDGSIPRYEGVRIR